jgi:hypothetical protein
MEEGRQKYRVNQRWVPMNAISPYLVKAVLIGEDDRFWSHEGFDYEAGKRRSRKILRQKFKLEAAQSVSSFPRTFIFRLQKSSQENQEAIITWRMEKALSKKRILELYLNIAEWGDGVSSALRLPQGLTSANLHPLLGLKRQPGSLPCSESQKIQSPWKFTICRSPVQSHLQYYGKKGNCCS